MGHDVMKIRRRNLRAATNTLLFIISVYLISNLLNLFLSVMEYLYPGLLQRTYPYQYRICSDCASLMTVLGNALRFPAHICSNKEISEQLQLMLCATDKEIENLPNSAVTTALTLRRFSERVDNPWFSALLTTPQQPGEEDGSTNTKITLANGIFSHKGRTNGLSFQHILPQNRDDITTKYLPKTRSFFHTPNWFGGKGNTTLNCDCPNPELLGSSRSLDEENNVLLLGGGSDYAFMDEVVDNRAVSPPAPILRHYSNTGNKRW